MSGATAMKIKRTLDMLIQHGFFIVFAIAFVFFA